MLPSQYDQNSFNIEDCIKALGMVSNCMPGGVIAYVDDATSKILHVNKRALEIFDCSDEKEFYSRCSGSFFNCVHPDDVSQLRHQIENQESEDSYSYAQFRVMTAQDHSRDIEVFGHVIRQSSTSSEEDLHDTHFILFDDLRRKHRTGDVDQLTGLLTMSSFERHAKDAMMTFDWSNEDGTSLAYLSIDLENFKMFNAEFGYEVGDDYLRETGAVIKSVFPQGRTARFSDDHFVVLTESKDIESRVELMASGIREAHPNASMQAKVGIYLASKGEQPISCVDRAKAARNAIKKDYTTVYRYYTKSDWERLSLDSYLADHVDEAIEKRWIMACYQPVIRVMTGNVCGWEALVRWQDPVYGLMMPGDFIATLERFNLAYKLDLAMAHIVCRDLRDAMEDGKEILPVSLNLSRTDFQACDMPQELASIAEEYGVPFEMIHIEITESALCDEESRLVKSLDRLNEMGFNLWMDDFGSGYSTLSVLKDYDFDMLKIDMRFLRETALPEHANRARAIITSVVTMAKQIGMRTLAEGVETIDHLKFLNEIGCEMAQGYLFSKPIPLASAVKRDFDKELYSDSSYYDAIGHVEMLDRSTLEDDTCIMASVQPTILGERIDRELYFIKANDVFAESVRETWNLTMEEYWEKMVAGPESLLKDVINNLADRAKDSRQEERETVRVTNEDFGDIRMRYIATNPRTGAEAFLVTNPRLNEVVFV